MSIASGNTGMIRLDMSRSQEYLKPEYWKPKLSFGQKLGRFFGKAFSFLGSIAAAVTSVAVPGVGLPIAAGLFGLSNVVGKLTAEAEYKDYMAVKAAYEGKSKLPVVLPGLFDQANSTEIQTDFMVPKSLERPTTEVIINRELTQNEQIENFDFY